MRKPINIERCFERFVDLYSPKIVAELNGQQVKVVRLEGDKVPWHTHDAEDEMFYVVDGVLDVHEGPGKVTLHPGELYVVRRGTEHRVVPHGHVRLILFEPAGIAHTGDVRTEITVDRYDVLEE